MAGASADFPMELRQRYLISGSNMLDFTSLIACLFDLFQRDYPSQWQSRQHSIPAEHRWQSGHPSYPPPSSSSYYGDGRDSYPAPPGWTHERSYYDEPPPIRQRDAPPSPIYPHVPPIDGGYRAPEPRNRTSSWEPRGGVPRSPPRRTWSVGRHPDMPKDDGSVQKK